MNKSIKNIITMLFGTGLNLILGVITVPIITHIVSPLDYGKASLIQTYINIFVTLCMLGLEQAYVRFYYSKDTIEYRRNLSKYVIKYPLFISILIAILVILFGNRIFNISIYTLILIGFCIVITVTDTFTRLSIRLEQNAKLYSFLLIVHRIVYAAIIILLIYLKKCSAVNAILMGTSISLLATVIVSIFNERQIWLEKVTSTVKEVQFKTLILYSYPFIFSSISNWIFTAADKLALQKFSTLQEIGYYSAASNIVALIAIIQTTFSTLWVPLAVQNFESSPNDKSFFIKSNDIMSCIMFFIGATLVLFKDVFPLLLGGNYAVAKYVYPCLILYPIMFTLSETTVYGLNFYKKTQWHMVITTCSCVINIILNIIFVQFFGSRGAAISTGISYIVFFFLRTYLSNKYFKVKFHLNKIIILMVPFVFYLLYNTFFNLSIIVFVFYILIVILIVFLYKNTIIELFNEVKKSIYRK